MINYLRELIQVLYWLRNPLHRHPYSYKHAEELEATHIPTRDGRREMREEKHQVELVSIRRKLMNKNLNFGIPQIYVKINSHFIYFYH